MSFNEITGANAGERLGFAGMSHVVLRHRSGVAQSIVGRTPAYDISSCTESRDGDSVAWRTPVARCRRVGGLGAFVFLP